MTGWQRPVYWLVLFVLGLLVQTALLPLVFPSGYVPSVMIALVVVLALYETPIHGLILGLMGGAILDLFGGRLIGLNTLSLGLLGYVIAYYQPRMHHDAVFLPGVLGALSPAAVMVFEWVLLRLVNYPVSWHTLGSPLPYWVLFGMLFTPAVASILGFRPQSPGRRRR